MPPRLGSCCTALPAEPEEGWLSRLDRSGLTECDALIVSGEIGKVFLGEEDIAGAHVFFQMSHGPGARDREHHRR